MRHAPRTVGDERSFGVVERVSGRRFHQNLAHEDAVQSVCFSKFYRYEWRKKRITVGIIGGGDASRAESFESSERCEVFRAHDSYTDNVRVYSDDAIERAIDRLRIDGGWSKSSSSISSGRSSQFKSFAVCHRDCFSKALVAKEDTKDEMEKWKSRAVTNAVAKAVSKITRIDKVRFERSGCGHLCRCLGGERQRHKKYRQHPDASARLVVRDERVEGVHGEIERNRSYEFKKKNSILLIVVGRR